MFGEKPVPFVKYPFSKKSETFVINEEDLYGHTSRVVQGVLDKLIAEEARLRRLLPDPPAGYHWQLDRESSEDLASNVIMFRVVARLKENDPWTPTP